MTVGSSPEARFEELVQTVTTPECLLVLKKRGFTSLVIQQGNGRFLSSKVTPRASSLGESLVAIACSVLLACLACSVCNGLVIHLSSSTACLVDL